MTGHQGARMGDQDVQQLQGEGHISPSPRARSHQRSLLAALRALSPCSYLDGARLCHICLLVVCLPLSFTQPPKLVVNGRGGFKTATRRLQAIRHDAWHRMECGSGSIGKQIVHIPLSSVEQTRYRDEGAAPKFMKTRVV